MIRHINRWASIAESIDNCQHSPIHIHTSRISYQITRLSDDSMINQEGPERKVKLCNMFVYNVLVFPTKIIEQLTSAHSMQLVDPENIHFLQQFRANRTDCTFLAFACCGTVSKGKAILLQAWRGPEGFRRLRFPDFKTIGT